MRIIGFLFFALLMISCKKEKLNGESAILIGKWTWIYSIRTVNTCNPPTYHDTLTVSSEGKNYSIEFIEKGKVVFAEVGAESTTYLIKEIGIVEDENLLNGYTHSFTAILNDNFDENLSGIVGNDSMRLQSIFPFENGECENYKHYFKRM